MFSQLQKARLAFKPKVPKVLEKLDKAEFSPEKGAPIRRDIQAIFPHLAALYSSRDQDCDFDRAKAPGFALPKSVHISNIDRLRQGKPRELSHGSKSNPDPGWSIKPLSLTRGKEQKHRPLKVGVVLSGGQAPGGHNVIAGLFDALQSLNKKSTLIGFLRGPEGIVTDQTLIINKALLSKYRNQGGFDIIGSGRTKIETKEQFQKAKAVIIKHDLDGLVVVGGDDSNTNAAWLAEYFLAEGCKTSVVGVPKTIDGDLKSKSIEVSFGFDTASKSYAATIGSLMRDALSAKKYYYFIKLMGRSASHLTLECALQTHPNMTFISEEVAKKETTLIDLVESIADLVCKRAEKGKHYGVILIPEGLVEFIPEVKLLLKELNRSLSSKEKHAMALEQMQTSDERIAYVTKLLSEQSKHAYLSLPKEIQAQLILGRDAHGNVQVSKIETERLLMRMVKGALKKRKNCKAKFEPQPHFCGYEGRSCMPSNFDSNYCYALGMTSALLIDAKTTGYISTVNNLVKDPKDWTVNAVPIISQMTLEMRLGEEKPVIEKALVDLKGKPFSTFQKKRKQWELEDDYVDPGPLQYFGPKDISDAVTETLRLEQASKF